MKTKESSVIYILASIVLDCEFEALRTTAHYFYLFILLRPTAIILFFILCYYYNIFTLNLICLVYKVNRIWNLLLLLIFSIFLLISYI